MGNILDTIFPTIDGPCPTTNSSPPTTHFALNVCEALCHPSLCETSDVKDEIGRCFGHLAYLAGKSYQQLCAWSRENRSPCLMPWMDCACCARNIRNRLKGREVMLAHCGGKQVRDQKAAGGLTTSMWCRFHPTGGGDIPSIPFL